MKLKVILALSLFVSIFANASVNANQYATKQGEVFKLETLTPNNVLQIFNILKNESFCNNPNTRRNQIIEDGTVVIQYAVTNQQHESLIFRIPDQLTQSPIESITGIYFPNVDDDQRYAVFSFFISASEFVMNMKNIQSQGVHYSEVESLIIKQIGSCLGL